MLKILKLPPSCRKCKHHINGICKLFKYSLTTVDNKSVEIYVEAQVARQYEQLCGVDATLFEKR